MLTSNALIATIAFTLIAGLHGAVVPAESVQNNKEGRIIGGLETSIETHPYQVSVRLDTYTLLHICGGSIYAPRVIVTAAHCIKGRFASYIRIVAGKSTIIDDDAGFKVSKLIPHSGYNKKTHINDVGLIILAEDLKFSARIQPIPLAMHKPPVGASAIVTGWGKNSEEAEVLTSRLQMVDLEIVDSDYCSTQYSTKNYAIVDEMVCAGVDDATKDSCNGDSGGPLVVDGELVGIVSWGIGCGREGFPGVYASVPFFTQWIEENAEPYL